MSRVSIRKDLSAQYRMGVDFGMVSAALYAMYWAYVRFNEVIVNASYWYGWQSLFGLLVSFGIGFVAGRQWALRRKAIEFNPIARTVGWVLVAVCGTTAVVKGATDAEKGRMLVILETQRNVLLQDAEDRINKAALLVADTKEKVNSLQSEIARATGDNKKTLADQLAKHEEELKQRENALAAEKQRAEDIGAKLVRTQEEANKQLQAFKAVQDADPTGTLPDDEKGKDYGAGDAENGQPGTGNPGTGTGTPGTGVTPQTAGSQGGNTEALGLMLGMVAVLAPELLPVLGPLLMALGLSLGTETVDLPAVAQTAVQWHEQGSKIDVPAEVKRLRAYRYKNPSASVQNLLALVKTPGMRAKLGDKAAAIESELQMQLAIWQKIPSIAAALGVDETVKFIASVPDKLTVQKIGEVASQRSTVAASSDAWLAIVSRYIDLAASDQGTIKWNGSAIEVFKIDATDVAKLKEILVTPSDKVSGDETKQA